jgi:hypothetical protein
VLSVAPGSPSALHDLWWRIYGEDPAAVPPLKRQIAAIFGMDDPYLNRGERQPLVVYGDGGRPLATAVAFWDGDSAKAFDQPTGFFSQFEAVDDPQAVRLLFDAVGDWLRKRGAKMIVGPMSPKIGEPRGILVDGSGRPLYGMPYTPAYYPALLNRVGFHRIKDLFEFIFPVRPPYTRLQRLAELAARRFPELSVRSFDMKRLDDDLAIIAEVYNESFASNWGFLPLHIDELAHLAQDLRGIYRSDYGTILEINNRCVGFQMSIPDLNVVLQRLRGRLFPFGWVRLLRGLPKIEAFRGFFIAILPRYRWQGLDAVLISHMLNISAPRLGISAMHVAYVLEDNYWWRQQIENTMRSTLRTKRYRLFGAPC